MDGAEWPRTRDDNVPRMEQVVFRNTMRGSSRLRLVGLVGWTGVGGDLSALALEEGGESRGVGRRSPLAYRKGRGRDLKRRTSASAPGVVILVLILRLTGSSGSIRSDLGWSGRDDEKGRTRRRRAERGATGRILRRRRCGCWNRLFSGVSWGAMRGERGDGEVWLVSGVGSSKRKLGGKEGEKAGENRGRHGADGFLFQKPACWNEELGCWSEGARVG